MDNLTDQQLIDFHFMTFGGAFPVTMKRAELIAKLEEQWAKEREEDLEYYKRTRKAY